MVTNIDEAQFVLDRDLDVSLAGVRIQDVPTHVRLVEQPRVGIVGEEPAAVGVEGFEDCGVVVAGVEQGGAGTLPSKE